MHGSLFAFYCLYTVAVPIFSSFHYYYFLASSLSCPAQPHFLGLRWRFVAKLRVVFLIETWCICHISCAELVSIVAFSFSSCFDGVVGVASACRLADLPLYFLSAHLFLKLSCAVPFIALTLSLCPFSARFITIIFLLHPLRVASVCALIAFF